MSSGGSQRSASIRQRSLKKGAGCRRTGWTVATPAAGWKARGVFDLHVHAAPDIEPRLFDDLSAEGIDRGALAAMVAETPAALVFG